MPEKKTKNGQPYKIDGKRFLWSPLDDDDVRGNLPDVMIPMRVKFKLIRSLVGDDIDADGAVKFIDAIAPGQAGALDEMDVNDIMACFTAWQTEYQKLQGASLGE